MPKLAIALNAVGDIPTTNPFFHGHLTKIAPGRTSVVSFTKGDMGLQGNGWPAIEVDRQKRRANAILRRLRWVWKLFTHGYHDALPRTEVDRIARFLLEEQVRVVLAEDGHNGCAMLPACKKAGIPLYTHFHGADIGVGGRRWEFRASYRHLAKHGDGFIAPSHFLADKLRSHGFPERRTYVIHCGVNVDDFSPTQNKEANLVVAVGRFIPKKAPHRTVEAFAMVLQDFPGAKLEMIGNGPLLESTIERAQTLGVDRNVIFTCDNTDNGYVRKRLPQAQVFVQHSVVAPRGDIEAFGITPVEAMACEVPVVVTRHNGFVETVVDGETGYLTPEHDVRAMADAIKNLLADCRLRVEMGKRGRQRVIDNFTDVMNIQKLQKLLLT